MSDVHSREVRSYNMSQIRGKDTKPELIVRKYLFSRGFRYRVHDKKLPGQPDIVLKKYNTVIFVHGCFWHAHENCKYHVIPKTRREWWIEKLEKTKSKDKDNILLLAEMGWNVIIIWECKLKKDDLQDTLQNLGATLIENE